jgi:hypothetical protein
MRLITISPRDGSITSQIDYCPEQRECELEDAHREYRRQKWRKKHGTALEYDYIMRMAEAQR